MACGGCRARRAARKAAIRKRDARLVTDAENINAQQLNARLEKYKRKYCTNEPCRYECDYGRFLDCKKRLKSTQ